MEQHSFNDIFEIIERDLQHDPAQDFADFIRRQAEGHLQHLRRAQQLKQQLIDQSKQDPLKAQGLRQLASDLQVEIDGTQAYLQTLRGRVHDLRDDFPAVRGLTTERVEKFEHFTANESMEDEQCIICLEDLKVGMEMVRLDCHVSHYFCQTCTDAWFKNHNKCPTCNHVFN